MTPDINDDRSIEELARELRESAIEHGDEDVVAICDHILEHGGTSNDG